MRNSKLSRSIEGKVAIVTGAASGMGRATAMLFADEGATVALVDLDQAKVDEVVATITSAGGTATGFACDLADPAKIESLAAAVRSQLGPVDIVVNNAGVPGAALLSDASFEDVWEPTMAVNVAAQMRLVRACFDDLQREGAGRIVNIASTEGLAATLGSAAYTASKHAVVGLTKAMAVEFGKLGVTANAICPGPIHTGMTSAIPDEAKAKYARRRVPMQRYGDPEEVAHMTLSLVLPASSFINGAIIPVDGGLSIKSN